MNICLRGLIVLLAFSPAYALGKTPRFTDRSLPTLLEFTGSRCAYDVEILEEPRSTRKNAYATDVLVKQFGAWGESTQVNLGKKKFRIVSTKNLRAGVVPTHIGNDYYRDALSVEKLSVGERYILICNETVFEAIPWSKNAADKVQLLMKFNWQEKYPAKASRDRLYRHLKDPDLYVLAYNELNKRERLMDSEIVSRLRGIAGVRLFRLHLASLKRSKPVLVEVPEKGAIVKTERQVDFIERAFGASENHEMLRLEIDRILSTSKFREGLTTKRANLLVKNFQRMRKNMAEYEGNYLTSVRRIVRALSLTQNRSYAGLFSSELRFAAMTGKIRSDLIQNYIGLLPRRDAKVFLAQLMGGLIEMAGDKRLAGRALYLMRLLTEELPKHPSVGYLRLFERFDPYQYSDLVADETQLGEEFNVKSIDDVKRDLPEVIAGVNLVVVTLTEIMDDKPRATAAVHRVGSLYIAPGKAILRYLSKEAVDGYVAAYKTNQQLLSQKKSGSRR